MSEVGILFIGIWLVLMVVVLVLAVLTIVGYWMIFKKAGEAGWKSLIPFYSTYTEYKLFWNEKMFVLWLVLALASFALRFVTGPLLVLAPLFYLGTTVMYILISIKISYSFGHGVGYALGLIFLPPVFLMILAFDNSAYIGPGGQAPYRDIIN